MESGAPGPRDAAQTCRPGRRLGDDRLADQRLARPGGGGHHDRAAVAEQVDRPGLVTPQPIDTESFGHHVGQRSRQLAEHRVATREARDVDQAGHLVEMGVRRQVSVAAFLPPVSDEAVA